MVLFSGCGGSSEGDDPGASATAQEMEQEFRQLVRGTIEAAEIDPKSLKYLNRTDFSYDRFAVANPSAYCGSNIDDDRGRYRITLDTKNDSGVELYTVEQYEAKVAAVWDYWRSLGMDPKNTPSGDNAWSIAARTPLGGKITYRAGQYGDFMSVESACSEKIRYGKNWRS